jgi:hypothetical protein
MKHIQWLYCIAPLLFSFLFIGCAGTENSERANPGELEQVQTDIPKILETRTPDCGSFKQVHAGQDSGVVRLLEPPFMTPKDKSVLPQQQVREYANEPYVLRFQVVDVDVRLFREFLWRESGIAEKECWAKVKLKIFDEEPIVVFRDTLVVFGEHVASDYSAWTGRSQGDEQVSFQFVIGPGDAITMKIESKSSVFQVNWTDSLPYHVLWEWDTNFFGPSIE